jgi:hypothetical protein
LGIWLNGKMVSICRHNPKIGLNFSPKPVVPGRYAHCKKNDVQTIENIMIFKRENSKQFFFAILVDKEN